MRFRPILSEWLRMITSPGFFECPGLGATLLPRPRTRLPRMRWPQLTRSVAIRRPRPRPTLPSVAGRALCRASGHAADDVDDELAVQERRHGAATMPPRGQTFIQRRAHLIRRARGLGREGRREGAPLAGAQSRPGRGTREHSERRWVGPALWRTAVEAGKEKEKDG